MVKSFTTLLVILNISMMLLLELGEVNNIVRPPVHLPQQLQLLLLVLRLQLQPQQQQLARQLVLQPVPLLLRVQVQQLRYKRRKLYDNYL
jgi:hypothetical protein